VHLLPYSASVVSHFSVFLQWNSSVWNLVIICYCYLEFWFCLPVFWQLLSADLCQTVSFAAVSIFLWYVANFDWVYKLLCIFSIIDYLVFFSGNWQQLAVQHIWKASRSFNLAASNSMQRPVLLFLVLLAFTSFAKPVICITVCLSTSCFVVFSFASIYQFCKACHLHHCFFVTYVKFRVHIN